MKKILFNIAVLSLLAFSSCIKEIDKTFNEKTLVEFNSAVLSAPAVGKTYPVISLLNKDSTVNAQVNLVGVQRATETSVTVSIDKDASTGVENTHFKLPNGGKVVFPANTSIASFQFQTLKVPAQAGTTINIVFILEATGDVAPSENYKRVGYAIKL
jgi:hypothetical protein